MSVYTTEQGQQAIDDFLYRWFSERENSGARQLWSAMGYSVFSGGKRFRPLVTLQVGRLARVSVERLLPFAAAVELVHTYSLIHDDLPVMDNDDWRRGRPTNHRMYGEDIALLAGDGLLTEAFLILAKSYNDLPELSIRLVRELSEAAGPSGMVAGQVLDLKADREKVNKEDLLNLHRLKTGALIAVSAKGAGILGRLSEKEIQALAGFGLNLGLAFQVADDLLDHHEGKSEPTGLPRVIGVEECRNLLNDLHIQTAGFLKSLAGEYEQLLSLVDWNRTRAH